MNVNQHNAWMAMNELGDYFSRLGGAARPRNMAESEIPLYVITKLLELHTPAFRSEEYLNLPFLNAAELVLKTVNAYLKRISLNKEGLFPFLRKLYDYADAKLDDAEKTDRWFRLGRFLREKQ